MTIYKINKILLCSTDNYIHYPAINHNGKEREKEHAYICTTESLCYISETNTRWINYMSVKVFFKTHTQNRKSFISVRRSNIVLIRFIWKREWGKSNIWIGNGCEIIRYYERCQYLKCRSPINHKQHDQKEIYTKHIIKDLQSPRQREALKVDSEKIQTTLQEKRLDWQLTSREQN